MSSLGTTAALGTKPSAASGRERRAFGASGAVAVHVDVDVNVNGLRPGDVGAPSARIGEGEPAFGRWR